MIVASANSGLLPPAIRGNHVLGVKKSIQGRRNCLMALGPISGVPGLGPGRPQPCRSSPRHLNHRSYGPANCHGLLHSPPTSTNPRSRGNLPAIVLLAGTGCQSGKRTVVVNSDEGAKHHAFAGLAEENRGESSVGDQLHAPSNPVWGRARVEPANRKAITWPNCLTTPQTHDSTKDSFVKS